MNSRILTVAGAALLLVAAPAPLSAQEGTATLTGTVQRDSTREPVAGATVLLPQLRRETTTDARGAFRLERLPAGELRVVVRGLGSAPREDTVTLAAGATTTRDFILGARLTRLDSVQVTAPGKRYVSPGLRGFEDRRRHGGGRYITEEVLREHDGRRLSGVITSRISGLRAVPAGGATHLAATRSMSGSSGLAFQRSGGSEAGRCYVNVYLDGALIYDGAVPGTRPPDFDRMDANQFAAIEFYTGGATVPPQFNRTSNGCGVLLLWTRER